FQILSGIVQALIQVFPSNGMAAAISLRERCHILSHYDSLSRGKRGDRTASEVEIDSFRKAHFSKVEVLGSCVEKLQEFEIRFLETERRLLRGRRGRMIHNFGKAKIR